MYELGLSAVVLPVPAVDPIVSPWRDQFDPPVPDGMPPHITALFPFLPEHQLTDEVVGQLQALCAACDPMTVEFAGTARFPGVLYLQPEPADELRDLTLALAARWPEVPPYGGLHDDVVPHLTVALGDDVSFDAIETALATQLPVRARLREARLYVFDGSRWQVRAELPLGQARGESR